MPVYYPVVFMLWDEWDVQEGRFRWAEVELGEGDIVLGLRRVNESPKWGWEYTVLRPVGVDEDG